jgi:hypothetical protein
MKYFCPNPNCKKVFSRPKIIKYTVCPTCQTLVDDTNMAEHVQHDAPSRTRKVSAPRKLKIAEPADFPEKDLIEVEEPKSDQSKLKELFVAWASAEEEESEKAEAGEKKLELEQAQQQPQENMELSSSQRTATVETEQVPKSSPGCQYGFGYLSHRDRGAKIPDSCIECPDSLNCMLSEYHKSGESVKEISKWYQTP